MGFEGFFEEADFVVGLSDFFVVLGEEDDVDTSLGIEFKSF